MEWDRKLIAGLPLPVFINIIKLAIWADKAEEHGMELAYQDNELLVFRRKVALDDCQTKSD